MQNKKCFNCRKHIRANDISCKNCGLIVGNICDKDIKLIKSKKLRVVTPRLLAAAGLPAMLRTLNRTVETLGRKGLQFNEIIFCSYCYSSAFCLAAKMKTGKDELIKDKINFEFMKNSLSLFKQWESAEEFELDVRMNYGLSLHEKLDELFEKIRADAFSNRSYKKAFIWDISEIIYGNRKNFEDSLILYINVIPVHSSAIGKASKFFIVEETDFDFREMNEN